MLEIIASVTLLLAVFIAYRVHEINMRLKILDLRHRVRERFMGWVYDEKYAKAYDEVFGELYVGDYNKLLRFGRQNELHLPLRTLEEEKARVDRLSKTEEGVKKLVKERERDTFGEV